MLRRHLSLGCFFLFVLAHSAAAQTPVVGTSAARYLRDVEFTYLLKATGAQGAGYEAYAR